MEMYIAIKDQEEICRNILDHSEDLGYNDYQVDGFKSIGELLVDHSGFGTKGESALTINQFTAQVKKGLGYAIIGVGQFQVIIGVFKKLN